MSGLKAPSLGFVSRYLPAAFSDDSDDAKPVRLWRYGEACALATVRKQHALVDEGNYFVTNNGQTGIASSYGSSSGNFFPTNCLLTIFNADTDRATGKRIYLDYVALVTTVAGDVTGVTDSRITITTDVGNKYSSGGTNLTPNIVNANMDAPLKRSAAIVYFGNVFLTGLTASARTVCGLRILRPIVSAGVPDIVGEMKILNFGGVEQTMDGSINPSAVNQISYPLPAIVIGPQQSLNIHYCLPSSVLNTRPSFAPEIAWWER